MEAPAPVTLTRRRLLIAGGVGLLLAGGVGGHEILDGSSGTGGPLTLYRVFDTRQPVGRKVRLPLALAAADGSLDLRDPPASITFRLRDPGGGTTAPVTVGRRAEGIPRGYYPAVVELSTTGTWTFEVEVRGQRLGTDLSALDASALPAVPGPGDPLPRVPTPTAAVPLSVHPICTRDPACPFHAVSLDVALALGRPIVLLVSTPAHCQTAICGPVLDLVVARRAKLEKAGATVIHAEVYTDDTTAKTSSTVDALGLTYEPSLFYAGPDGIVKGQLGYTFDATELDEQLAPLLA